MCLIYAGNGAYVNSVVWNLLFAESIHISCANLRGVCNIYWAIICTLPYCLVWCCDNGNGEYTVLLAHDMNDPSVLLTLPNASHFVLVMISASEISSFYSNFGLIIVCVDAGYNRPKGSHPSTFLYYFYQATFRTALHRSTSNYNGDRSKDVAGQCSKKDHVPPHIFAIKNFGSFDIAVRFG